MFDIAMSMARIHHDATFSVSCMNFVYDTIALQVIIRSMSM
jgi:hypothetical protein